MRSRFPSLLLAVIMLMAACSSADPEAPVVVDDAIAVGIDGGTETVLAVADVVVRARPGDTVRITSANRGVVEEIDIGHSAEEDADDGDDHGHGGGATVVHSLVSAPTDALPPIFVSTDTSAAPNAAVWGPCRGGDPAAAVGSCPVIPIDGPTTWDGEAYWSTGAMLPTESREVPLAADIAPGTYSLICVFHPELAVHIEVTDEGPAPEPVDAPQPGTVESVTDGEPDPGHIVVAPGDERTRLNRFWPATTTVAAGETVTWTTEARTPHDVVLGADTPPELLHASPEEAVADAPDGPWDGQTTIRSGYLTTDPDGPVGTTFAVTFAQPGTYKYYCRFHPLMTGTVVVT